MNKIAKTEDLTKNEDFQRIKTLLEQANRILLSTHLLPDGDGLGAETALFHYLKQTKKIGRVLNPDPVPKRYEFLDPTHTILSGPDTDLGADWNTIDLWIIVDTNDPRRLGQVWEKFASRSKQIVFLDHHASMEGVAEVHYPPHAFVVSDPNSSSIGELLYRLFSDLNLAKMTPEVAKGLYVSIMTDTNSFRYARTTPLAHHIAAEMIQSGVNPEEIYQSVYSSKQVSHIQLMGHLLQKVKISPSGRVAWLEMNLALRKKYGASADDTLSFLNLLLLIKDAEVICFFREEENGQVRVSIKSKGRVSVHRLAMELGGGGHEFAAGASLNWPLKKAISQVIKKIDQLVLPYPSR